MGFIISNVLYSISLDDMLSKAVVVPLVAAIAEERASLIVSLEVDRIELLPSAKIDLEKGFNVKKLRAIEIYRPLLWWPSPTIQRSFYSMELKLSLNGAESLLDTRRIGIRDVYVENANHVAERSCSVVINKKRFDSLCVNLCGESQGLKKLEDAVSRMDRSTPIIAKINDDTENEEQLLEWCDNEGVMVWRDTHRRNGLCGPDKKYFEFLCEDSSFLSRCRNNPSLVIW